MSARDDRIACMGVIAAGSGYFSTDTIATLAQSGLRILVVHAPEDLKPLCCDVLCLTPGMLVGVKARDRWREAAPEAFIVSDESQTLAGEIGLSNRWPAAAVASTLSLVAAMGRQRRYQRQLAQACRALSCESPIQALPGLILREARQLAACDVVTLFLTEKRGADSTEVAVRWYRSESMESPMEQACLALDPTSIEGYVVVSGHEVNVTDVYAPPADAPWRFNDASDRQSGYRTRSLYATALRVPSGDIIGGLAFINCSGDLALLRAGPEITHAETRSFTGDMVPALGALASLAAAAIDGRRRLDAVDNMFEGFMTASVAAIEQRDPVSSGHSFRVARLTQGLAEALPRSGLERFRNAVFSDQQLRELRYAALLHDFGKIGVTEPVLLKAHKLTREHYLAIRERITLETERIKRRALAQQLVMLRSGMGSREELLAIEQELNGKLEALEASWEAIQAANQPGIRPRKPGKAIHAITDYSLSEDGTPLLTAEEQRVLSIPHGSLTSEERREIEMHVAHTVNFLRRIPWIAGLAAIPEIVGAHHEKLDGSGYPHGYTQAAIPFPSQLMTVADIYDALTAADRPYKKSLPSERAFMVLEDEATHGKLDADLVKVFIEARVFDLADDSASAPGPKVGDAQ